MLSRRLIGNGPVCAAASNKTHTHALRERGFRSARASFIKRRVNHRAGDFMPLRALSRRPVDSRNKRASFACAAGRQTARSVGNAGALMNENHKERSACGIRVGPLLSPVFDARRPLGMPGTARASSYRRDIPVSRPTGIAHDAAAFSRRPSRCRLVRRATGSARSTHCGAKFKKVREANNTTVERVERVERQKGRERVNNDNRAIPERQECVCVFY